MAGVPQSVLSQPAATPNPSALYNLPNYTSLSSLPTGSYGESLLSTQDPYNLRSEGDAPGGAFNEQTSPGYQQYGNNWLNLISALSDNNHPTTKPGYNPSNPYSRYTQPVQLGIGEGKNPLGLGGSEAKNIDVSAGQTPTSDTISSSSAQALPIVAKALGLDPNSQQAKDYANAYVTYVLQTREKEQFQDAITSQNSSGSFENIFGEIGKIGAYALAGGAEGFLSAAPAAAGAAGSAAAESGATTAASTGADLSLFNAAGDAINAGAALAQHNPLGALESVVSGASGLSTGSTTNGNINTITSAPSLAPAGGESMSWLDDIGNFFSGGGGGVQDPSISGAQSTVAPNISGGTSIPNTTGTALPNVGTGNNISGGSAAPAGSSFSNFLSNPSLGGFGNFLSKNSNILLPAAGLGFQAIEGNSPPKGLGQIEGQAAQLNSQGAELQSYLSSGKLPPGVSSSLKQAGDSAKAAIKSQYAQRGMSGSSAEAQDLANVDNQISTQGTQIATQLLQQGIQETGLSAELYNQIMQSTLSQDKELGTAVANFAASAAGGGTGGNNFKLVSAA